MGKPDNQPAAEKSMIKPYKEEKPYDLALLDRRPDDLASLVEMMFQAHARQLPLRGEL